MDELILTLKVLKNLAIAFCVCMFIGAGEIAAYILIAALVWILIRTA